MGVNEIKQGKEDNTLMEFIIKWIVNTKSDSLFKGRSFVFNRAYIA